MVYLRQGEVVLPTQYTLQELVLGNKTIDIEALDPDEAIGLTDRAGRLPQVDIAWLGAGRVFKKTSEQQAQWLVSTGVKTWRAHFGEEPGGSGTGLFLGLATVDCDDEIVPVVCETHSYDNLAKEILEQTKPLSGLTLLNSSATSHLAGLLNITGVNSSFSPHADAGGCAIVEAYYNVLEGECERALCGAGSQKVTPWYFLSYESILQGINNWFPTEAAAFFTVNKSPQNADGVLKHVRRVNCSDVNRLTDKLAQDIAEFDEQIDTVIHAGLFANMDEIKHSVAERCPAIKQIFLDSIIGYTGPAAAAIGINLALTILLDDEVQSMTSCKNEKNILVVVHGLEGQLIYLLVGDKL